MCESVLHDKPFSALPDLCSLLPLHFETHAEMFSSSLLLPLVSPCLPVAHSLVVVKIERRRSLGCLSNCCLDFPMHFFFLAKRGSLCQNGLTAKSAE